MSVLGRAKNCTSGIDLLLRLALDTNVLVYAENVGRSQSDPVKVRRVREVMNNLQRRGQRPLAAYQSLAELFHVLVAKAQLTRDQAAIRVQKWIAFVEPVPTDEATFGAALGLATDHRVQIYDAIILAAAVDARSDLLLSEDMQDGFAWRGVTVVNPFAPNLEPRLARLLA